MPLRFTLYEPFGETNQSSNMLIREFRWPDDYEGVVRLWEAAGLYNAPVDGLADIHEVWERNPGLFLLMEEPGGAAVGSVIGTFDGRRAYIYHVAVYPDYQRKGIGKALLGEVEKRIWALGARKLRFMVNKDNEDAQAFYRTLGFEVDSFALPMSKVRPSDL